MVYCSNLPDYDFKALSENVAKAILLRDKENKHDVLDGITKFLENKIQEAKEVDLTTLCNDEMRMTSFSEENLAIWKKQMKNQKDFIGVMFGRPFHSLN